MIKRHMIRPRIDKKINKRLLLLIFIIVMSAILCSCIPSVMAAEDSQSLEEIKEELENNVGNNLSGIDLSALEKFVAELGVENESGSFFGTSLKFFIETIIKGDFEGGFGSFLTTAFKMLGANFLSFLPVLITIVAIAIIFSIIDGMSSGFLKSSTHEVIYFVCYAAAVVLIVTQVMNLAIMTKDTVYLLRDLMNIVFPILLTLMTALGGTVSVSAYQPMLAVLSVGVVNVITALIIPCFIAALIFGIVGNLSKTVKLDKITKFFKSFAEFILGLVFSLFMFFVTFEGITGSVVDSISVKSAKFALSSYVPILGGYLSDGFDLIMASCVLVKNSIGLVGLFVMLFTVLSPIITIYMFSLGLKLTAGIIEPIADKRFSDLLFSISKSVTLLAVTILGVAFMFMVMVMLIIFTGNMGAI